MSIQLINRAMEAQSSQPRLPRLIEIVGPAGAGKSTICKTLAGASQRIHLGNFPDVRNITDSPFFAWNGLRTIPGMLRLPGNSNRRISPREFAWLSILNGWPRLLQKQIDTHHQTVVLDQGPVYLLTELCAFGPDNLRNRPPERSLQALYARWARMLDAIVWLDAPNTVLAQRIRGRKKEHIVKGQSAATVFAFIDQFRAAYARTLSLLAAENSDFRVLVFDTDQQIPDQITADLLVEFGLRP